MTHLYRRAFGLLLLLPVLTLLAGCSRPATDPLLRPWVWELPPGFPTPKVPADNPMSYVKADLGRHLFYDQRLSSNGTQSCASCHQADKAFTDGKPHGVGSTGGLHPRGAQSLVNVAYLSSYTWANPLIQSLEAQAMVPLFGGTPVELGNTDAQALVQRFAEDSNYQRMFKASFPNEPQPVSLQNLLKAIACFERTIISGDSPYDHYFLRGEEDAISEAAKRGNELFFSERLECNHCHSGFHLMDSTQHANSRQPNTPFNNTGLYNIDGKGAYPHPNRGILEITGKPQDMGRFRSQTLRNIMLTAPYFHDGSAATIDEVLDHYAAGGRTIATGEHAGRGADSPLKSQFVIGFSLTAQERADLKAFFEALTDPSIATRPEFQAP